jgi:hypothetical protein
MQQFHFWYFSSFRYLYRSIMLEPVKEAQATPPPPLGTKKMFRDIKSNKHGVVENNKIPGQGMA